MSSIMIFYFYPLLFVKSKKLCISIREYFFKFIENIFLLIFNYKTKIKSYVKSPYIIFSDA